MKKKPPKTLLLPLFIGVIKEYIITAFKMFIFFTMLWWVISGIVNSLPITK